MTAVPCATAAAEPPRPASKTDLFPVRSRPAVMKILRAPGESVQIGDDTVVTVLDVGGGKTRLAIKSPLQAIGVGNGPVSQEPVRECRYCGEYARAVALSRDRVCPGCATARLDRVIEAFRAAAPGALNELGRAIGGPWRENDPAGLELLNGVFQGSPSTVPAPRTAAEQSPADTASPDTRVVSVYTKAMEAADRLDGFPAFEKYAKPLRALATTAYGRHLPGTEPPTDPEAVRWNLYRARQASLDAGSVQDGGLWDQTLRENLGFGGKRLAGLFGELIAVVATGGERRPDDPPRGLGLQPLPAPGTGTRAAAVQPPPYAETAPRSAVVKAGRWASARDRPDDAPYTPIDGGE